MSETLTTRIVTWAGLGIVLAAAAILSFDALRSLALAVSIPPSLAWLLPVAVDAGAAVSCSVWLSRRAPEDATRVARGMTWALLALTVVGNAAQLGMHANGITPPWWVAVIVGAVPPAVVGGVVHLSVLVARGVTTVTQTVTPATPKPVTPPKPKPAKNKGEAPLSAAERQRRYREKNKKAATVTPIRDAGGAR